MNADAELEAKERQLSALLDEALGDREPPDVRAAVAARVAGGARPRRDPKHWLAAALIPFGIAVAIGVGVLRRDELAKPVQQPVQPRTEERGWVEVHGDIALAERRPDAVHLKCFDVTDDGMRALARWTRLESLDLSGCDIDERGVSQASKLTGAGLVHLAGLRQLRWLSVSGCNDFTGEGLTHLEALPNLEHLDLTYTHVTAEAIARLHRLPSLRELSLASCGNFPSASLADVAKCAGLQQLSLNGCYTVRAEDVPALAQLRSLRELDLGGLLGHFRGQVMGELPFPGDNTGLTNDAVRALAALPLRTLTLSGSANLTDATIETLAGMKSLLQLELRDLPRLTGAGLDALPAGLLTLGLDRSRGIDRAALLRAVARQPDLVELGVPVIDDLRDEDVEALLSGHDHLRVLRLAGSIQLGKGDARRSCGKLTTAIGSVLAKAKSLEVVHLDGLPNVDATTLRAVATLPKLKELVLAHNDQLRDGDLTGLAAAANLTALDLQWCTQLTHAALSPLADLRLQRLQLYGTVCAAAATRAFAVRWPGCEVQLANAARWIAPAK